MKRWRVAIGVLTLLVSGTVLTPARAQAQTTADCPPNPLADASTVQPDNRNRGLLWRISRDGRSSYLFATMHMGRAGWREVGPVVQEAVTNSDLVAIELDAGDPDIQRQVVEAVTSLAAQPVAVPEALRARIAALARRACIPEAALGQMHPMMQMVMLAVMEGQREQLHPLFGQEFALKMLAQRKNKHVLSLETPAQQFSAMLPQPGEDISAGLERTVKQLEAGRTLPLMRLLVLAWEHGDLEFLQRYASWCECVDDEQDRKALVRLIDDRNLLMAERIDELHQRDMKIFAAVGALHMTGPKALQQLMQQRGYKVERIPLPR
jgi:uncharacterized protein